MGRASRGGAGRKAGAKGYRAIEIRRLLSIMELIQPVSTDGWQRVNDVYNKWATEHGLTTRELDNLRKKYKTLTRFRGEDHMGQLPEEVKEARRIERLIVEKFASRHVDEGPSLEDVEAAILSPGRDVVDVDGVDDAAMDDSSDAVAGGLSAGGGGGGGLSAAGGGAGGSRRVGGVEAQLSLLGQKLDERSHEFGELRSTLNSFLDNQKAVSEALLQQNQQLLLLLGAQQQQHQQQKAPGAPAAAAPSAPAAAGTAAVPVENGEGAAMTAALGDEGGAEVLDAGSALEKAD